jgi:hypothetical protein
MEKPASIHPDDIRNEKVNLLSSCMFCSVYVCSVLCIVSLCCSLYCLCVNVYWTASTGILGHFLTTLLEDFHAFFSVVRHMPGYNSQRRGTACTSKFFFIVMYVPFSVFCVLFVCKCVLYYCHQVSTKCVLYCCHRVSTQLQLKINNNNNNNIFTSQ